VLPIDIVFFALVAIFLGWRLYTVLGRRNGNERQIDPFGVRERRNGTANQPPDRQVPDGRERQLPIIDVAPDTATAPVSAQRTDSERRQLTALIRQAPEDVQRGLRAIASVDGKFDAAGFLAGAKIAFGMIVEAFAAGDLAKLKPLLSPAVFESFAGAIAARDKDGLKLATDLIGIVSLEIAAASLLDETARVTLKFTSQQISVTRNAADQIVAGDPKRVLAVEDIWTFERPVRSRDPNWFLAATGGPA